MNKVFLVFFILLTTGLLVGCGPEKEADFSDNGEELVFNRFEQKLFSLGDTISLEELAVLKNEFGPFLDVFAYDIMSMSGSNDTLLSLSLSFFVSDTNISALYDSVMVRYATMDVLESKLQKSLSIRKSYFPSKTIPKVYTYLSAFNYGVVTADSILGIGLDMFLGSDNPYYQLIGFPTYLSSRFSKEYIIPNCLRAICQSDYDPLEVKNELLSQMVYQGKVIYYIKNLAPDLNDTLVTGYSGKQLAWCDANESSIWGFFIENKLLFNTDASEYMKYVSEGPTTKGFPEESPGKVGAYTGWQIVNRYMERNEEVTLEQLMNNNDALQILEASGYKPNK